MHHPHAGVPAGYDRVRAHTAPVVNDRLDERVAQRLRGLDDPPAVAGRLARLDREWDIDRALMLNFVLVGGAALTAGLVKDRRWLYLFGAQMGFLLLHALNGWCPPVSLFRRLGVRTRAEIEAERYALLDRLGREAAGEGAYVPS